MKSIFAAIRLFVVLSILTGVVYPLMITGIGKIFFHSQSEGSVISLNGKIIGSSLLAQKFISDRYFWQRPSAGDYATVPSGSSNLGPTSADLQKAVQDRENQLRTSLHLKSDDRIPEDLIFASASGLDPHISPGGALIQVERIAEARKIGADRVKALVEKMIEPPQFGIFGNPRVNVLLLNLALDQLK
jgi:K+-transporting ATPase ATPase C chain